MDSVIGTVWRQTRSSDVHFFEDVERLFLVIYPHGSWLNHDGYVMLDLMTGQDVWGWDCHGCMHVPSSYYGTGSVFLERFA